MNTHDRIRIAILSALCVPISACAERYEDEVCLPIPESGECKTKRSALRSIRDNDCGERTIRLLSEPTIKTPDDWWNWNEVQEGVDPPESCCYEVLQRNKRGVDCTPGRPITVGDASIVAPVFPACTPSPAWSDIKNKIQPNLAGLSAADREVLAEHWMNIARGEHASVASFSKLVLDLMRLGAPAQLIIDAQKAAQDEIEHAQIALALASAYADQRLELGALPIPATLELSGDIRSLLRHTLREGCWNETLSALEAAQAALLAQDATVMQALSTIAADEERHAQLAWRIAAWALEQDITLLADAREVWRSIAPARSAFADDLSPVSKPARNDLRVAHGLLPKDYRQQFLRTAQFQVIAPVWRAIEQQHRHIA